MILDFFYCPLIVTMDKAKEKFGHELKVFQVSAESKKTYVKYDLSNVGGAAKYPEICKCVCVGGVQTSI